MTLTAITSVSMNKIRNNPYKKRAAVMFLHKYKNGEITEKELISEIERLSGDALPEDYPL